MNQVLNVKATQAPSTRYPDAAARWNAVRARDRAADGAFVYAVRTTSVYCRPSCGSRLPLRANAEFFDDAIAAERAGYRACKRCRPDGRHPRAEQVRQLCAFIDQRLEQRITLAELAAEVQLSPFHVQRLFKAALGISPRGYQEARRMQRFRDAVQAGATISAATFDAGFGSGSRLYASAARHLGMRPGAYRKHAAGERIDFASVRCTLGTVLVAATARGVCRVMLGDSEAPLVAALRAEYSGAAIERDARGLGPALRAIEAYLDGSRSALDVPLDLRATAFQLAVWAALQRIPRGETRSYTEIARELGKPRAQRAVGSACGSNPVALLVPCHRALRSDGSLGGYAFGLERKRKLLALERERPPSKPRAARKRRSAMLGA